MVNTSFSERADDSLQHIDIKDMNNYVMVIFWHLWLHSYLGQFLLEENIGLHVASCKMKEKKNDSPRFKLTC